MTQLLLFVDKFQFSTSWGGDIAKLIILYFVFKVILILFKVTSKLIDF